MCILTIIVMIDIPLISASPSFSEQFISVPTSVYFPNNYYKDETNALNLEGVFYDSSVNVLNTKLILNGKNGFTSSNTLSYGMLINSDFDFKTGFNGFDHRYKVQWTNGTWIETYEKIIDSNTPFEEINTQMISNPATLDIMIKDQIKSTIDLKLDLKKIGLPETYTVVFFTEGNVDSEHSLIQDVSSLAIIPPLEFSITTYPSPLSFESSIKKTIHIFINSDFTNNIDIYYNVYSESEKVSVTTINENKLVLKNGNTEIPVLLEDIGHDDIIVHKLYVELIPEYSLNIKTNNLERGGEIFESFNYKNHQKSETVTILWTSLPQPGWNLQLGVQIAMLAATLIMSGLGIFTYISNTKFAGYEKKEKHKQQIIKVYKQMQSLILKFDYNELDISLQYLKDNHKNQDSSTNTKKVKDIYERFNNENITLYHSTLEHMKEYDKLNTTWCEISEMISEYNKKMELIKQEMKVECLKFIKEKMPNFKESPNESDHVFFLSYIVTEIFNVLNDKLDNKTPTFNIIEQKVLPSYYYDNIELESNDDEIRYHAYSSDNLLFSSTTHLPNEMHDIGDCVEFEWFQEKYDKLFPIRQNIEPKLEIFKMYMRRLINDLDHGDDLKGKCRLGY